MRHHHTAAAAMMLAGLALTACSTGGSHHDTPSTPAATQPPIPTGDHLATGKRTAACWKAIRDQYQPGTAQLTGAPTTPPQCSGLSTDELASVAEDVLEHQTG